ncbi:MAG: hypothetical protein II503_06465, partial [Clostridia bacterium]|nr:hypothetical protein [Clostridia bacterium]
MRKPVKKILSAFLACFAAVAVFAVPAFSLSWDGSSTGGGGGGSPAGPKGYAIRYTDDRDLVGYRFSAVDKSGANKVTKVIDVFLNADFGNFDYDGVYKFSQKYNETITAFITGCRMDRAKELMKDDNNKLEAISFEVGYDDYNY